MKNIFDTIDYKFFQVFSGENRRIHAEVIMVVSDFFKPSSNARAALRDAYPSDTLYNEVNVGFGVYWHWHVKVGGTKVNGVHSFYGLPV